MSLNHGPSYKRLAVLHLIVLLSFGGALGLSGTPGQAEEAVEVAMTSRPLPEDLRPDTDLATVTLTALLHGKPLAGGHLTLQVTAPPRARVLTTDFPHVEGTTLLWLTSDLQEDGTFTLQYLFPIRGLYTFAVDISPVLGGPVFRPTHLRKTIYISENPAEVRNAWLLIIGLFVLGGIVGVSFYHSAAAQGTLRSSMRIVSLLFLCGTLVTVTTVSADTDHAKMTAQTARGQQVVQGQDGWELEVHPRPESATVGQLVELAIWLKKDGEVFSDQIDVLLEAAHQEDAHTVLQTAVWARTGQTTQRLQLFDGAPHTIAITAHPLGEAYSHMVPLTITLELDVRALHPPMAVKIRLMALLLMVLVSGMAVGFFFPRRHKEPAGV